MTAPHHLYACPSEGENNRWLGARAGWWREPAEAGPGWTFVPFLHCSPNTGGSRENLDNETETDSVVSSQRERPRRKDGPEHGECWKRRKSSAGAWCGASAADMGQLCLLCRSFPAQKGLVLHQSLVMKPLGAKETSPAEVSGARQRQHILTP